MDKPRKILTRREREIMDVIFELGGEVSAEQIREKLPDPPSSSAVRAMLAKLEAKGVIRHEEKGLKYVYMPTASRSTARRSALRQLVRVFFEGSAGQAMAALLQEEDWSEEELNRISQELSRVKKEKKR
jgi:BlaI family transcriptional regulator, penicillinase repressor